MTQSIASLGIRVTSQGVAQAERDLGKLAQSGAKVEAQTAKTAKGMQQTALSAKQLQAATRGLPAQFTDIATALGSGQRPLQVLLQQGGQLKDMFGGIGPAARALGGYVAGMINPVTLLAGASVALFAAWRSGVNDTETLRKAIILTGGQAGLTTRELMSMASELDRSTNATAGAAAQALAQVTSTGKFTAEQIGLVTRAALNMQDATGKAIDDTVKEFASLAADPVDAILKLNEAQNFLTRETLEQIESLKKQGREADAAAVAIRAYADTINSRSAEITGNLDLWSRMWRDLKNAAGETFDELKAGLSSTNSQILAAIPALQRYLSLFGGALNVPLTAGLGALGSYQTGVRNDLATAGVNAGFDFALRKPTVKSADERRRQGFEQDAASFKDRYLSREEQKKRAIAELDKFRAQYTSQEYANLKKQIDLQFAPAKGRTGGRARKERERPDFGKDAARELERLAQIEDRATESFLDMQAALSGPLAEELRNHEKRIADLNRMAKESPVAMGALNSALALEAKRHDEARREIERQLDPLGQLLENMRFELDMIGQSNAVRAVMIELRRNNIDLMSAEAQAALGNARAFDEEAKARQQTIDLMDGFRDSAENALVDFATGAKSAKDALKDFFNELAQQLVRAAANNLIGRLFGQQGSDGGGTTGGNWLSALLGAFTGGGRAIGGPVSAGRMYQVNEKGAPEIYSAAGKQWMLAPHSGQVIPMRGGGGAGMTVVNNFTVDGRTSRETQAQVAQAALSGAQRAQARSR